MRGLLAAFLLIAPWGLALGQPNRLGPEFQVNTYTYGSQRHPSVAADRSGNFVVVWSSLYQDGSFDGVFGQRFDSAGAPLGGEFQVNTYTTNFQSRPSVAADGSGNFVVVWQSYGQDASGPGVFGQRFDSAGTPLGGEFQVNTYTMPYQRDPSVAMDASGNFVVAWTSYGQYGYGSSIGVFGRRFDSAGAPLGGEFQVNTYTTNSQLQPFVAMDRSGNFVVVWSSVGQDGSGYGVFGQRFDSAGAPLGGEFQVNTYTTSHQGDASVAVDGLGNFVVAWTGDLQDGSQFGIFARRFDSAGAPLGGEFQVNTYTTEIQEHASVALDDLGSFVVLWSTEGLSIDSAIRGQRFDGSGAPLGGEFQVNTYTTGFHGDPSVAVDRSGNFVVAWESRDGSGFGVFGQRFACNDLDGDGLCDARDVVVTSPLDGGTLDCSNPAVIRPVITWSAGNFEKFRVSIASDASFAAGTTVTSGDRLLSSTTYAPPIKKWQSACKKALAANPSSPELYFKVYGVDVDAPKKDINRKTFSQIVRADVTP